MEARERMNGGEQRATSHARRAQFMKERTWTMASDPFLWAAAASIVGSASLFMKGEKRTALFVGQWAPTFLALGTYNKMLRLLSSD